MGRSRFDAEGVLCSDAGIGDDVCHGPAPARESKFDVHCWRMAPTIERISAITFRVLNMKASVQFYRNVLGMELLYGGEWSTFSSVRANDSGSAILNLEQGDSVPHWGRLRQTSDRFP